MYRARYDIYAEILSERASTTRSLMRRVRLSYSGLRRYVGELVACGMLAEERVGRRRIFTRTSKGVEYLRWYRVLKRLVG